MSLSELFFRFYRQLLSCREGSDLYQVRKLISTNLDIDTVTRFRQRVCSLFPSVETETKAELLKSLDHGSIPESPSAPPSSFPIFELKMDLSGSDVDWHQDPFTGKRWPKGASNRINIRDAGQIGEVNYTWRVNRFQHALSLAKPDYAVNSVAYSGEILAEQIVDWIRVNPYMKGVNWTSSMEMAIRCISWMISIPYIIHGMDSTDEFMSKVCHSILLQGDYIYNHLSRYSSANNHLIVELTGLFTIALAFQDNPEGYRWLSFSVGELAREAVNQIYNDGVNKEQSTNYHSAVLDCFLWITVLGQRGGTPIPRIIPQRTEAMCDFLYSIMDSKGHVPAIGDSDDGYLFWPTDMRKLNNFRSQLATCAVLFNRPDFKASAGKFDEKSHWFLGDEGFSEFDRMGSSSTPICSHDFPDSGYYVLRSGETADERLLVFDCGPLGYPSTAAHGHADALSIVVYAGGSPLLIDCGTYSYLRYPVWRDHFRGTAAHNTVMVNRSNQSESGGPYIWARQAQARCDHWYSSKSVDYVVGSHTGYKARHGVTHRRRILFIKSGYGYWLMEDCLDGKQIFSAESLFHFHEGELLLESAETYHLAGFTTKFGICGLNISMPHQDSLQINGLIGSDSTMEGWVSEKYGHRFTCPVLRATSEGHDRYRFTYVLLPSVLSNINSSKLPGISAPEISWQRGGGFDLGFVDLEEYTDRIYLIRRQEMMLSLHNLKIIAETVHIRADRHGVINSVLVLQPSSVTWNRSDICPRRRQHPFYAFESRNGSLSMADLAIKVGPFEARLEDISLAAE